MVNKKVVFSDKIISFLPVAFPAPNNYSLPSILGGKSSAVNSAPNYSMTGRSKIGSCDEDLSKAPGPGTYSVVEPSIYKKKDPLYSMTGRNQLPSDSTLKPGPGAHSPEKVILMEFCKTPHLQKYRLRFHDFLLFIICLEREIRHKCTYSK